MTLPNPLSEFEQHRNRRLSEARDRRMLNNLPLAHRLAAARAEDAREHEQLLGQAMVGLVAAVESFEAADTDCRFGAYAEPHITDALDRMRDEVEVEAAHAHVAQAVASRQRVRELASFLDVPVEALVGGLMDVSAREGVISRRRHLRGVA